MSDEYSEEKLVEDSAEIILRGLRWEVKTAWRSETFAKLPDRSDGLLGRANPTEVILHRYLMNALQTLNPGLPLTAYPIARKTSPFRAGMDSAGGVATPYAPT